VELVKMRGLSVAEAAALSGQSPGAIKVNVHRALRVLRTLYQGS
jgi:DNA-directed RNA polymerase specialized sigma24 family protein